MSNQPKFKIFCCTTLHSSKAKNDGATQMQYADNVRYWKMKQKRRKKREKAKQARLKRRQKMTKKGRPTVIFKDKGRCSHLLTGVRPKPASSTHMASPAHSAETKSADERLTFGDRVFVSLKRDLERDEQSKDKQSKVDKKKVKKIKAYLARDKKGYLPNQPNEYLVDTSAENTLSVYLEPENDSGNMTLRRMYTFEKKYIDWNKLPPLQEANEEMTRFKAALDCIHTFGGRNNFDDLKTLELLEKYSKQMEKIVETQRDQGVDVILEVRWDQELAFDPEYKDPTEEELIYEWANITTEEKELIDTVNERQRVLRQQVLDRGQENFTDLERVKQQLKIRQWAETVAKQQMPVGTQFYIYYSDDNNGRETFTAEVTINTNEPFTDIEFVYKDVDSEIVATLDFVQDEFSLIVNEDCGDDEDGDDEDVDEIEILENETILEQKELKEEEEQESEQDDDYDDDDDNEFVIGELVRYMLKGEETEGVIEEKLKCTENCLLEKWVIDGIAVPVNDIFHLIDNAEYVVGQTVVFPEGSRTITKIVGETAYFGDDVFSFDVLNDIVASVSDENKQMELQRVEEMIAEFDITTTHTWKGKVYKMVDKPYLEFTEEEWTEKNKKALDNDDDESDEVEDIEQSEVVDLRDINPPYDVVEKVPVDEIDEEMFKDEEEDDEEASLSSLSSDEDEDEDLSDEDEDLSARANNGK